MHSRVNARRESKKTQKTKNWCQCIQSFNPVGEDKWLSIQLVAKVVGIAEISQENVQTDMRKELKMET
jgi:hypothetical protein